MPDTPLPSEMMRKRRPYLFSDSKQASAYHLNKEHFDYCLHSLTARNEHQYFELFARKVCEREICPNITPSVGPEGGGDGKVDADTHPVSEMVSETWFQGEQGSAEEKWAFAFSCKEDWRAKVQSDVKSIMGTNRGYEQIFFVTNQYDRSKDRHEIQDKLALDLSQKYSVRVTMLGRRWLIEKTLENGHQDLAYKFLKVGEYDEAILKIGPEDTRRNARLEQAEEQISALIGDETAGLKLYPLGLDAAIYSRELERPKTETMGRFDRAIKFARKYGTKRDQLTAIYEKAWTQFWWYDELDAIIDNYEEIEKSALSSDLCEDVDRCQCFFQLLIGPIRNGVISREDVDFDARSKRLTDKLSSLASSETHPNNALHARTMELTHNLSIIALDGEEPNYDVIWEGFIEAVSKAKRLPEFPAQTVEGLVSSMGPLFPESEKYDELIEVLAEFMGDREKDAKAGELYLQSGRRCQDRENYSGAIKWFGKACLSFAKAEYEEEQFAALTEITKCYYEVDLYWAARASGLAGLNLASRIWERTGRPIRPSVLIIRVLIPTFIQLGDFFGVLTLYRYLNLVLKSLELSEELQNALHEEHSRYDQVLALLITTQSNQTLEALKNFPDILDQLGLYTSNIFLLTRLGYIDELRSQNVFEANETDSDILETHRVSRASLLAKRMPKMLFGIAESPKERTTRILGVDVNVKYDSVELRAVAETHVSALEAFLATAFDSQLFPTTESLSVIINTSQNSKIVVDQNLAENCIIINWPKSDSTFGVTNSTTHEHFITFCGLALAMMTSGTMLENSLENLAGQERAFERATMFSNATIFHNRVFGTDHSSSKDWNGISVKAWPPKNPPIISEARSVQKKRSDTNKSNPNQFEQRVSHKDAVVRSPININLWNEANWRGIGFMRGGGLKYPVMGMMFTNANSGKKIFEGWKKRYGEADIDDVRISIIRGIDKSNPYYYRTHICSDRRTYENDDGKMFYMPSRTLDMTPTSQQHLNDFLLGYSQSGSFILAPFSMADDGQAYPDMSLGILKKTLNIVDACLIDDQHEDFMALRPGDDPHILSHIKNAPVLDSLKKINDLKK